MDITALETDLSEAASLLQNLDSDPVATPNLITRLHACEQQLARSRFVRRHDQASGRSFMVRIPGIESALIHVTQAIVNLQSAGPSDAALHDIEGALEDIALIPPSAQVAS
ncbi:MAG TPA: hypothetical protein VFA04_16225 [Bryobacteraceae bacterium]|jgi:hypothetical protein|nr:hypothetical protein [Bryobacteraceae bacterium]